MLHSQSDLSGHSLSVLNSLAPFTPARPCLFPALTKAEPVKPRKLPKLSLGVKSSSKIRAATIDKSLFHINREDMKKRSREFAEEQKQRMIRELREWRDRRELHR
uniref:Uncharacterized protein n=1 Tax=Euplotes harpa TaxID=151035 RepID=A0A7S3JPJ2_9SPIT|mmetsp:Transcript_8514/g.9655  ORF Transcript_8514/g.9655 Transcript_8514/m.9655 type:complete len:105 (+) Transcript_8514:370-684(+)